VGSSEIGSVAIAGAGISGLAAARALSQQGLQVRLFDKGRRPGGRISTRREGDFEFDLGAQYFTAADERFRAILEQWTAAGAARLWNVHLVLLEKGTAIRVAHEVRRYVGVPGMSAISQSLASGLDIVNQTEITAARHDGDRWRLTTGDGSEVYDRFLVAAPPSQALPLLTQAPQLTDKIRAVEMLPVWTVMIALDAPLDVSWDAAFVNQSSLSWIARNSAKPGRGGNETWVLHGSSEWSTTNLERSPDEICADLLSAFFEATGMAPRSAQFEKAHLWRSALVRNPLGLGSLWDPELEVGVAGDWCTDGSVEGAYLSGLDLAERVLGTPV
jgi:renalase